MKILITGAAGFIGFNFSKYLLENSKFKILGIDNLNNYYSPKIKNGFKLVIYANQLLRAAYPVMEFAAKKILENSRSFEIDKKIIPIKKIINLIQNEN
jgi:phosphoenolpyruvate phosphomutase|tara:strand:- start:719 stop:1012 length:294 start_codon:yes stop_codon:yes gene_type:complete